MKDWAAWNVAVGRRVAKVMRLAPGALTRFDFTGEGWGFSILPDGPLPDGSHEVYGDGTTPLLAVTSAVARLHEAPSSRPSRRAHRRSTVRHLTRPTRADALAGTITNREGAA